MRLIITGGTGLIGRALTDSLVADGHHVIILSRAPRRADDLPNGVQVEAWDAHSAAGWGDLVNGADAIINLAGAGVADARWTEERKALIRDSRLKAGQAVVSAIEQAATKPKVLLQSSAVGYYGTTNGDSPLSEDAPPGDDFLSGVSLDWEASTAPVEALGVRRVVLRTGVVLSTDGGAFPKMLLPFKFFAGGPVGDGKQWFPWIHMADEVAAIRFLIETETAQGAYNLTAPNPVTNGQFAQAIGQVMGRPAFMPAPAFALKTVLGDMATVLLDGQRAVPQRLQEAGFTFQYPTAESALRNLLN